MQIFKLGQMICCKSNSFVDEGPKSCFFPKSLLFVVRPVIWTHVNDKILIQADGHTDV